jgi:membrane-bound lytic murein transglycosylase F
MRKTLSTFLVFIVITTSCGDNKEEASNKEFWENPALIDLEDIKKRGTLRAVVDNSSTSYYIYRGRRMGYEYEMLRNFANRLRVQLQLVVTDDIQEAFRFLNEGTADIIAMNLEVSEERKKFASFTQATNSISTVLVQRDEEEKITDLIDLNNKNIHIRANSIYREQLEALQDTLQLNFNIIEIQESSENLVDMVVSGEIDYTVVDNYLAMVNATYYDNIDVTLQISDPSDVGLAVRKNAPDLLKEINDWILEGKKSAYFAILYSKYFLNKKNSYFRNTSAFSSISGDRISVFDDIIRKGADELGWDWRLLAALVYKESRFDTSAISYAGAQGLLQLMPVTLERFGVTNAEDPSESLMAGVAFLKYLDKFWRERVPDSNERIRFILSSYNVGHGHVEDAWRLALKYGKDSKRWINVAYYLERKSQREFYRDPVVKSGYAKGHMAVAYVRDVLSLYESYRVLVQP